MSLAIAIETRRTPNTMKFRRFVKAPENLYYFLLFSGNSRYQGSRETWRTWLDMGFNLEVRDAPPGAALEHHALFTMKPRPPVAEISVTGGDAQTLGRLERLLRAVENNRPQVSSIQDPTARAKAAMADKEIDSQLVMPVMNALRAAWLTPREISGFVAPLDQAIATLTDGFITSARTEEISGM